MVVVVAGVGVCVGVGCSGLFLCLVRRRCLVCFSAGLFFPFLLRLEARSGFSWLRWRVGCVAHSRRQRAGVCRELGGNAIYITTVLECPNLAKAGIIARGMAS